MPSPCSGQVAFSSAGLLLPREPPPGQAGQGSRSPSRPLTGRGTTPGRETLHPKRMTESGRSGKSRRGPGGQRGLRAPVPFT